MKTYKRIKILILIRINLQMKKLINTRNQVMKSKNLNQNYQNYRVFEVKLSKINKKQTRFNKMKR